MDTRRALHRKGGNAEVIPLPLAAPPGVATADVLASDLGCFPTTDQYIDLIRSFKDESFETCVDLCAVDYLEHLDRPLPRGVSGTRFEIVVNLLRPSKMQRVRLCVQAGNDEPHDDSLFTLYPGTEAMEREAFDLYGVLLFDHPDMTRILMPEVWDGHPLRRNYAVGKIPIQMEGSPGLR